MTGPLRVLIAVPAFNAGETTRGIEVARAIRDVGLQRGRTVDITFTYPRTTHGYEGQIREAGLDNWIIRDNHLYLQKPVDKRSMRRIRRPRLLKY